MVKWNEKHKMHWLQGWGYLRLMTDAGLLLIMVLRCVWPIILHSQCFA